MIDPKGRTVEPLVEFRALSKTKRIHNQAHRFTRLKVVFSSYPVQQVIQRGGMRRLIDRK
jgi:hypothetical protein